MASIFTIFGEIALNADSANRTIDGTTQKAGGLAKTFNTLGVGAKVVGKTVVAASVATAAAVGAAFKASAERYAEYEQLVGGVETLFKDSNTKVMQYANNAYKTAGLSANDYMQTVTSFSASLLQSLGGDTDKAADVADMALTDMADNANKMGTSMESIQNAYQGFAKQNYTMLDNLKLGYGGTKSEMQRLLKDASKLTGVKYDIKNLDDVYEAIHVIQTEMGITGTTAKEASETIAGSWAALGSAWENMLIGMSDSEADMDVLMENVFSSAETVAKNIGKLLPVFAKNLGKMLGSLGRYAGEKIKTGWTNTVWPMIQDALKVHFGVDLPDWETVKTSIADGWNNTIWPGIQNFYRAYFGIELPDWNVMVTDISSGWNDTIWPSIQEMFKTNFGIEIPSWGTVTDKISEVWENVKPAIADYFTAVFSIFTPDDNKSVVENITTWWAGVMEAVGNLMLAPFGIEFPDVVQSITDWWEGVKEQVSLTLGLPTSESGTHTSESDRTHGGRSGRPFGDGNGQNLGDGDGLQIGDGLVSLKPTDESEGEMIETVAGYDLEGMAQIFADPNSEAWVQAVIDSWNLRAPVTLEPTGSISFGTPDGSHAGGLDRVPFDGYRAILHKDEAVLRASEAAVWRREKSGGSVFDRRNAQAATDQPITVNLTVNGVSSSPYEIAGEVRNALELLKWRG